MSIYNIEQKYIRPSIKKYGRVTTKKLLTKLSHGVLPIGYPPLDTLTTDQIKMVADVGIKYMNATMPPESPSKE